jgi:predicted neuraminidase
MSHPSPRLPRSLLLPLSALLASSLLSPAADPLLKKEFLYESAPFPSCHASTIAETPTGLVAAWFGGTAEKDPDVAIWLSRLENGRWSTPVEVANGIQPPGTPGKTRYPTWNPVLFQPKDGPLLLFYKCGPNPDSWWGMRTSSSDHGRTWSTPTRLPDNITGPVKNKPIALPDGSLLCPSSTENDGWRVHFERSPDLGLSWSRTDPINDGKSIAAIQPSILSAGGTHLLAVGRTRNGRIFRSTSPDLGLSWSPMTLTNLPNPNSGTDALTLKDGRHLLVYNHTTSTPPRWGGPRSPLNIAISNDASSWQAALVLEDEKGAEFSYPAVIQSADGMVHITWTWKRQRIRHAVINPDLLTLTPMPDGNWPASP